MQKGRNFLNSCYKLLHHTKFLEMLPVLLLPFQEWNCEGDTCWPGGLTVVHNTFKAADGIKLHERTCLFLLILTVDHCRFAALTLVHVFAYVEVWIWSSCKRAASSSFREDADTERIRQGQHRETATNRIDGGGWEKSLISTQRAGWGGGVAQAFVREMQGGGSRQEVWWVESEWAKRGWGSAAMTESAADGRGMRTWELLTPQLYRTARLSDEKMRINFFFFFLMSLCVCVCDGNCGMTLWEPRGAPLRWDKMMFSSGFCSEKGDELTETVVWESATLLPIVQDARDEGPPRPTKHLPGHHHQPLWWHP